MKKTIGSFEAKTHLPSLLARVAKGESFTITKRGQPIAVLSPVVSSDSGESLDDLVLEIKEFRRQFTLGAVPLRKIVTDGRK